MNNAATIVKQDPNQLTADTAAMLLKAFPCCFLYNKGELNGKGEASSGKNPIGGGWPDKPKHHWNGRGLGVICGPVEGHSASAPVHGLDFDIVDNEPAQAVLEWLDSFIAGKEGLRLVRVGKPPKALIPFTIDEKEPLKKDEFTTGDFYPAGREDDDAMKCQLEVLGENNQFVAYHTHPDTGQPYQWDKFGKTGFIDQLYDTEPKQLLKLTRGHLAEIVTNFRRIMAEHGYVEQEKRSSKSKKKTGEKATNYEKEGFFSSTNRTALANLSAWVPVLVPEAKPQPGGYRAESADLGRNLQEAFSFHSGGIYDFGRDRPYTAIDAVMDLHTDPNVKNSPVEAALWLCRQMGVKPESMGWRSRNSTAAADFDAVDEDGAPIRLSSSEAQSLAWQINQEVMRLLDLSKGDDQAAKVAADPVAIDGMINGAFWSGSASKVFMLTEQESLNRFTEKDSIKFLLKRFGKILDREAVEARVEQLDLGGEPDIERRRKLVNAVMATPNSVIIDHLKYHNQRDSIEWRVDMFATQSRLELLEDKARIVLTHKPFKEATGGYDQEVVDDYKQHFTRFDEFLKFLVMARFALDRKKAYLWLLADSDWGKGFLIDGILGQLEAKVETSIKEIEAVFEGKPVGRSPEEFKRAFALVVDEFKTVKSEIKQLQSRLSLAPKFQLTSSVEIFAKVFMSAESVASLVTENGVEDQFANRMSIFVEKGTIESRPLFNSKGKPAYRAALVAYAAKFMNEEIDAMRLLGEEGAQDSAEKWLSGFIGRNGLDTIYERFSDSLERVAMDAIEYLHRLPFDNHSMLKDVPSDTWHLKNARKMLDKFLEDTFDHSEVGAYRKRKDEILVHMSADGKGSASHRVNGRVCKCVMLKQVDRTSGEGEEDW